MYAYGMRAYGIGVTGSFFENRPERMPVSKLLPWVGSAVSLHYQRIAAEHGLTPASIGVLGVLAHQDGPSHRDLAARLGITPPTLTPVIDALEARGEVRRARDPDDRRVVRLWITADGRAHIRTAFAEVSAAMLAALPDPPEDHSEIIRSYLLTVLAAVTDDGRARPPAG